uniref:LOW QUALITY PROTEIN: rho GTPase-activating protein 30 n=1 Tax=Centroberyx gerrardi TaxID=166262 RepID=UPI003AAE2B63
MRRVRRKVGNKDKVFGCDLLEHLTASSQEIPQVLRSCSEFVEHHGVVDGIYRLSGVSSNIQKLRSEFDSDGSPDLNKDLYLQDIHCVSSLCKAYFRELPNPLLTYQLYDKFAEAVAIQLEEERLVKITDVLKELPSPHYRTLEFLMRHLVRMASHSSETNMHARNLAIVWAPNLLRSKDIEASGFNGTAAFMEVRVQSIVVEFILTHVPQLFPEEGASLERRKSLPSPSAMCSQDEPFFRSVPPQFPTSFGNISPGDGPLPIRPYHAIIEGTDKRKGSLKGRKWRSIFNIGGRFPDPRRRNKSSAKEKDRPALRPARSMDSLSSPAFPNEGSRHKAHPSQRPPSTHISPLAIPSPQPGAEAGASASSGYAVTYRRGTGVVSGGGGTQGTYNALDPDGLGATGGEGQPHPSRSPGLSTKVGRRAAMHITGPHLVTVPLHITSNLALGVLQGGGGDRVIHCRRNKNGGDKVEGAKEGGERVERKDGRETERKEKGGRVVAAEDAKEDKYDGRSVKDEELEEGKGSTAVEETAEGAKEEEKEEKEEDEEAAAGEERRLKPEPAAGGGGEGGEQGAKHLNSNTEEDDDENGDDSDLYMEMKGAEPVAAAVPDSPLSDTSVCGASSVSDVSDILNSTEVDPDDQEMSGYVQDNFDFLDHMDCSVSMQINEFSVEPPGFEDDEYEDMEQHRPSPLPQDLNSHRPLSADAHGRHVKSLSLPYMTPPFLPAQFFSEEDVVGDDNDDDDDDDDDDDYSDEDDEGMFCQSLPPNYSFHNLTWHGPVIDAGKVFSPSLSNNHTVGRVPVGQSQSSEGTELEPLDAELSVCKEPPIRNQEQGEVKDEEGLEKKEEEEDKADQEEDQIERNMQTQSTAAAEEEEEELHAVDAGFVEDDPGDTDSAATSCVEFPLPETEDSDETVNMADMRVKDEKEAVENGKSSAGHFDDTMYETDSSVLVTLPTCHAVSCAETVDISAEVSRKLSVRATEEPKTSVRGDKAGESDEGEESKVEEEVEDRFGGKGEAAEIKESEENKEGEGIPNEEQGDALCGTGCEIWDEFEEVVCAIIEGEESRNAETKEWREDRDMTGDAVKVKEEDEQIEMEKAGDLSAETNVSEEGMMRQEEEEGAIIKTEVKTEVAATQMETLFIEEEDKNPETQQDFEKQEINLPKRSEPDDGNEEGDREIQGKREEKNEEGDSKEQGQENEGKERAEERPPTPPGVDGKEEQPKEVKSNVKESKEGKSEESDSSRGSEAGVGRKLVISKQAASKVYQVKSVPVVPPKPQHCRLTALSLRQQQQQQRERERENSAKAVTEAEREKSCAAEQGKDGEGEDESRGRKERQALRERRRDGDEGGTRESSRNSPLSMCFDEAVAIATMRRGREKEREGEGETEGLGI